MGMNQAGRLPTRQRKNTQAGRRSGKPDETQRPDIAGFRPDVPWPKPPLTEQLQNAKLPDVKVVRISLPFSINFAHFDNQSSAEGISSVCDMSGGR
jgi:hypothetical protein